MKHPAHLSDEELQADCRFERTRRSGPGGQHRNKVETAVVIEHVPSGIRAEASERRSQALNRRQALHRLRVKLAVEVRTPVDAAPSVLWTERVRGKRLAISSGHDDFPALLAEALNVLAIKQWSVREAASLLGVTTTQLVKLLASESAALHMVNRRRDQLGMSRLK